MTALVAFAAAVSWVLLVAAFLRVWRRYVRRDP